MTRINPKSVSNGLSFKGYIWAEDTNDCPKANHTTYDMNKRLVIIYSTIDLTVFL